MKDIAWNNIRLKIPPGWDIGRIGPQQLMFQDGGRPRLELKWNTIRGRFSHQAHLKRLRARYKNRIAGSLEAWSLSEAWKKAVPGFAASGFSWKDGTHDARGMSLFCPVCRKATLLQFFFDSGEDADGVPPEILRTLEDHRFDGLNDWAVFDIRAVLPEPFGLNRYQFKPGNFALEFSDGKRSMHLLRWAPASVLLGSGSLAQFGEAVTRVPQAAFSEVTINGWRGIEWHTSNAGGGRRWFVPWATKSGFRLWRLWHLAEKNRIFGVKAAGGAEFDRRLVDAVCESYDSL